MNKGLIAMLGVMIGALIIASLWNTVPAIKNTTHAALDPTLGSIIKLDPTWGFIAVIFIITLLTTLVQKYTTDQEALKKMKEDGKKLQEEMKANKNNPSKLMELQKKQFESIPKSFDLTMKPLVYTALPLILLLRWFTDIFETLGNPKILLGLSWIWVYLIISFISMMILRKILKVY